MAMASLYRRVLPSPPAVEFASFEGKQLFAQAFQSGTMEGFFKLISYFQTQSEPAYCGLASLSMVLNALAIDPGRKWKGPWRWFDESMLDCCEPLKKIKAEGITFAKVACLAICNGGKVEAFRTNQSTIDDFRQYVIACTSCEDCHVITSYHRQTFKQTGGGHFSSIGGYHAGRDMVLILDVARFKYPPHWVPLALLWEAMDTVDEATGLKRGFMIISRPHKAPSVLYTLSCKHDSWVGTVKHLIDDVPVLLRSEDVKDVQKVLSVIFLSLPTNFGELIKWVVEVWREDDGASNLSKEEKGRLAVKEEVLKHVQETRLFKVLTEWLSSASSCCINIPSRGDRDTSLDTAISDCFQDSEALIENSVSPDKCCYRSPSDKCLKVNGDTPINSKQGVNMLLPLSETWSCFSSAPANSNETQLGGSDILTVLVLALPPHTWLSIKDEKLLEEFCSLVSTEGLHSSLQEEVLHLRLQLQCLRKSVDDELGVPSLT